MIRSTRPRAIRPAVTIAVAVLCLAGFAAGLRLATASGSTLDSLRSQLDVSTRPGRTMSEVRADLARLGSICVAVAGQYGGAAGQAQKQVPLAARSALHTHGTLGGNLPFTGLDLAWIVAAAIVLVLAGWLIYRSGRVKA